MARMSLAVLATLAVAAAAVATPSINVGTIYLGNGWSDQPRELWVSGGDPAQGLELNLKIGDGASGPTFASVDLLSTSPTVFATEPIFSANNSGLFPGSYVFPYTAYQGVVTANGTVNASGSAAGAGLIGVVRFNALSLSNGTYSLSLINTPEGRTNFAGVFTNITDGQIKVTYGGDANGDFDVDVVDLGILASNWKKTIAPPETSWTHGDFNGDRVVDVVDLGALATNWKKGVSGAPLPEPAALSLLALAVPAIFRRRK